MNVVYFVRSPATGLVKIGWTRFLGRRLIQLAANHGAVTTLLTLPGATTLEAHLHERFAGDRVHGEWFRDSIQIRRFLADRSAQAAAVSGYGLAQEGASKAIEPESSLGQVQRLAARLEALEVMRSGLSLPEARIEIARRLRVAPGSLENLRRGRRKDLPLDLQTSIAKAVKQEIGAMIDALNEDMRVADAVLDRGRSDHLAEILDVWAEVDAVKARIATMTKRLPSDETEERP